ncbi:helix-turn-helix domain-containing protein [Spongiimicrobium salis]|uniref:helix-turn-helix domain-containing protein n=1 Tax=Spongiimicrobium salis TaxID=1667022 RepID=UPI00374DA099
MPLEIENIIFSRFVKQAIPFEFITIKELYERCKKSAYDLSNPHRIQFHALIIITKGEGTHMTDFNTLELSPGLILPLTKGQVHAFSEKLTVEGIVISFEENFITENISEKNLFHFLHVYHTPSILIGQENLQLLKNSLEVLEQIHLNENTNLKADLINAAFTTLLLQIKQLTIYQHKTFESQRFKDFIHFKELLAKNYAKTHNAKEYAASLSVSYKYLNDICKEMSKMTAKAFIDHWLLLEIKRSISEDNYSSKEIAFNLGFDEPSNFIRFFKKFTGLTPNQFQKTQRT